MLDNLIHKTLWRLTEQFPGRTRDIYVDGKPYLRRFYLTKRTKNEYGEDTGVRNDRSVFLHYFYCGDEDRELHNHPWDQSISYILCGGYDEERRDNETNEIYTKYLRAGDKNEISHSDFHRISKVPGLKHTWSLFIAGKRVQDWGFWDRETFDYIPHEDFVDHVSSGYKAR